MEFRILGPLEVGDGAEPVDVGGARPRALLAILLLRRGEAVTAERLIDDLYGGEPPATAAKSLQAHVSRLRKALGGDGRLQTRGGGYALELEPGELDADRFAALVERAREERTSGDDEGAAATLREALALWRGPALSDFAYEDFAQAEVARLDELRLACLEERIDADIACGRHTDVIGELERLVGEHPLREGLRASLMLALYRAGRQADALEAYAGGRRALDELGLEPGSPLQELQRSILNHDPRLDPVARPAADEAPAVAPGRLATGVFVGRAAETEALENALDDARAGHGRLVLLSGEAGIGKSRLADELAGRARSLGVRVLWGRCWEAGGAPAFWPWVQALRSLVRDTEPGVLREQLGRTAPEVAHLLPELRELYPDLAEPSALDSDGARFRLFEATASFLRSAAAAEPLLVVLDDVHAADASSLLMLEFVSAELADARLLVLAAYRDPELDPGDPIGTALTALGRHASNRITLRGLPRPEVASFIEASAQVAPTDSLVAAIAEETEGNPLFVGEIVRLLAAEGRLDEEVGPAWRVAIPDTVKDVMQRRLRGLSDSCRASLDVASVIGREFPLDLLERIDGRGAAAQLAVFDEAIAARLVTDVPGAPGLLRFTHALVRDTLYDALPQARRLELHRATGEAIEALAGDDPARSSELAHHFFHALPAVDPELAVDHAARAAQQARELLAFEEAARLYANALQASALRPNEARERERGLLLGLGDALARSGDMPQARDAFLRAAALARQTGSAEDLAAAALGYGGRIVWARAAGDRLVVSLLEEALEALGDADTPHRARVLARLAGALRDERDPTRRIALGEEAVAIAERLGDNDALRGAILSFTLAGLAGAQHGLGEDPRRLAVVDELLTAAAAAGDKESECEGLMTLMLVHAERNEVDVVRSLMARVAALADELRQPSQQWFAAAGGSMLALYEGRFADAEVLMARALALGGSAQQAEAASTHAVQQAMLHRELGRPEAAYDELARVAAAYPARPFFRAFLAALCLDLGRDAEARRLLEELAPNRFEILPRDNEWLMAGHYLAETCCGLGDVPRAETLYAELVPQAAKGAINVAEGAAGTLACAVGELAALLGRNDEAVGHFRLAIDRDDANGGRPWAAHARVGLANVLARQGDADEAARLLDEAAATAAELGMIALTARIAAARDYSASSPSQ